MQTTTGMAEDRSSIFDPLVVVLSTLVVLPFLAIPLAHLASAPESATGFFHEELPYYVANGRAAFERGNGWLYPNPYDPDPAAPAIYFHWLLWGIGKLVTSLGLDPGQLIIALTLVMAPVFSLMTWKLVACLTRDHRWQLPNFVMAMTGGGLLVLGAIVVSGTSALKSGDTLLAFDPGRGLWFLNWGRNALFPTEAIYHCLVIGCWMAEIRGQSWRSLFWCGLLATTHPWSGLELLLTVCTWRLLLWITDRRLSIAVQLCLAAGMLAIFLAYYRWWLPQFDHHARLQHVWELDWSLSTRSAVLAYGLVLTAVAARLVLGTAWTRGDRFLMVALMVATGLVFHDRFIKPVQPLHFTRGYLWMPLFLLGLPAYESLWAWLQQRRLQLAVMPLLLLCFATDNLVFSWVHTGWQYRLERGYRLTAGDRALLDHLGKHHAGSVVLTEAELLNYLMPAYAPVRPWMGHPFNTPDFQTRKDHMQQLSRGDLSLDSELFADIDVIALRRNSYWPAIPDPSHWSEFETSNGAWRIWVRNTEPTNVSLKRAGRPRSGARASRPL